MDMFSHANIRDSAGKMARDQALQQVRLNSEEWMIKALEIVANMRRAKLSLPADKRKDFTGEDMMNWVVALIGKPHHHNVAGAMVMGTIKNGYVIKTGEYRPFKEAHKHSRSTAVYRWQDA